MKTITTIFLVFSFWGLFQRGYAVVGEINIDYLRHLYCHTSECDDLFLDYTIDYNNTYSTDPAYRADKSPVQIYAQMTTGRSATLGEVEASTEDTLQDRTKDFIHGVIDSPPQKTGFFASFFGKINDFFSSLFSFFKKPKDKKLGLTIPPYQTQYSNKPPVPSPPSPPEEDDSHSTAQEEENKRHAITRVVDTLMGKMSKVAKGVKAMVCSTEQIGTDLTESDGLKYHPGCEALAGTLEDKHIDKLYHSCLPSLKQAILKNATTTSGNGKKVIDRNKLFANMLDETKINPKEQRFLAMIFTSFGETRGSRPTREDEGKRFERVMKVVDNRLEKMKETSEDDSLTAMDISLDKWQFSAYNPGDPNLAKMINYQKPSGRRGSMKNAVKAFVQFERKEGKIQNMTNRIFHFVTFGLFEKAQETEIPAWIMAGEPVDIPGEQHHQFLENIDLHRSAPRTWGTEIKSA